MGRVLRRHLPVVVFAVLALVISIVGVAFGGSNRTTPKTVKRIAAQQVNKLAPGLSVAHAGTADSASHAGNADEAVNATRVNGADVCARSTDVSANSEDHPLCQSGPLIVSARCNNMSSATQVLVQITSSQSNSWVFGTATDGATVQSVDSPFLPSPVTAVDVSDGDAAPSTAKGGSATLSVGAPDGSSISGTFSVRAEHTGTAQGSCFATVGATAG
jgi:hypothetical protein